MSRDTNTQRPPVERGLPFWRQLRWNLILSFVLLAVLPMTIVAVITLDRTGSQAREQALNQLASVAELKQAELASWQSTSVGTLDVLYAGDVRRSRFELLVTTPIELGFAFEQYTTNVLFTEAAAVHEAFDEFFFYGVDGVILASSNAIQIGKSARVQPYFQASLTNAHFVQPPFYELGRQDELTIIVTRSVQDDDGTLLGVLAGRLDLDALNDLMAEREGLGDTGETYLVSLQSNYLLTESRFPGYELRRSYHSTGIDRALAGQNGSGSYTNYRGETVFGVYRWVPELQAALLAEIDESEAMAAYADAQQTAVLLAVLAALAAAAIGLYAATRFSQPILRLAGAAAQFAGGNLAERVALRERNELGLLARAFNAMADQLQELIGSLEARVAARTRDLFLTLEVGQLATRIYQQEELLPRVTEYIRERFNLYYTQVYLLDEGKRYAVLRAGTGDVGEQLLARAHRLDLRETSIVARAAQSQRPVLVTDTEISDIHKPNPLLPETRSEVAIPLIVGDEVLGVLDMQARQAEVFREDNLPVFEAMANQLASALRSAQSYAETQVAVERATLINRRLTSLAWESYLGRIAEGRPVGYEYDLQGVRPMPEPVEGPGAGGHGTGSGNGHDGRLTRPVMLRDQSIGTITLGEDGDRVWEAEELALIETVADQIAQILEQFRAFDETAAALAQTENLYEQTRRRAAEMQTVAEVGAEAAASLQVDPLLRSVSNLTKERFDLYHAHIYMVDDAQENLVLRAGAGEVGQRMVESRHQIPLVNQRSLVVQAARTRHSVIANNVTRAEGFLPNPLLPYTKSELAVPMIVGDSVIGVMDVQSDEIDRFTDQDRVVLGTLASQVAVAAQNARLFSEQVRVTDQLREVDRLKSEFLASMSHELRTPLNSIIGYAEVLLDGIDGDLTDDMEEDVSAIHGSGKHLLNLINDILDLAKIEAGQMDLICETMDLKPLAQDVLNTSRVLLRDRSVQLLIDMPDDLPPVYADGLRIRQVLSNLLTNAAKFTEAGSITIKACPYADDPAMLQVSVIDTGIGMTDDQLNVIFDRFRQVDQSHTRRAGGTGLGLSITQELVDMHGGTIWVESDQGVGSTFSFTLPLFGEAD